MRLLISLAMFLAFSIQIASAAESYRLQSGDRVQISVWQDQKLDREVVVRPDGKISFPLAGHLRAAGSSLETLEVRLKQRLQKFYQESLDVTALLSGQAEKAQKEEDAVEPDIIYVTGEVRTPGQFVLREDTTVLQAIALSGGLATFAAKRRIQVRRKIDGIDIVMPFNYKEVESGRDIDSNFLLQDGDVVIVPEKGLFR